MGRAVAEEAGSILKAEYTADSPALDRIIAALRKMSARFTSAAYTNQAERLARTTLSMAEADSSQAFVKSVNRAVGVDMSALMTQESLQGYIDLAVADNVNLIKSIAGRYFEEIEATVISGMRQGETSAVIARRIQSETGATYKRAKFIARDQMAKANSDIVKRRQQQAGITRFKWSTSQDQRVSGNPAGKYPNAKIKCYQISRRDIGYGPGVYLTSQGASYAGETRLFPGRGHINCRCTSTPQIEGVDY